MDGTYYPIPRGTSPTTGRIIRLQGMGLLSRPTSEEGTTEIGEPQLNLVTAYAAMVLFQTLMMRSATEQRTNLTENIRYWQAEVQRLSNQVGIRMRALGAARGQNAWHIEDDVDGRYLIFDIANRGIAVGRS